MKRLLKNFRDNPAVLPFLVHALRACRAAGVLRSRSAYSHVPYRGVVHVDCGTGRAFRIESRGNSIENSLYWEGLFGHEPESMRLWLRAAVQARVVLDIGANSGVFALSAAAMGAQQIHAFEPLPRVHDILQGNVRLNKEMNIRTWPYAVGAHDGVATIFDPGGDAPSSASLSPEFAIQVFGDIPSHQVPICTVDMFCLEHGITVVDLIKIDVEGYEEYALRGMREMVAVSRPIMLMEVLPGKEALLRDVINELWPSLFEWTQINEGAGNVSRNVLLSPRYLA